MESSSGVNILIPGLALLFIGLKLGGVIDWSWWWVTLPLWGGFALICVVGFLGLLFFAVRKALR